MRRDVTAVLIVQLLIAAGSLIWYSKTLPPVVPVPAVHGHHAHMQDAASAAECEFRAAGACLAAAATVAGGAVAVVGHEKGSSAIEQRWMRCHWDEVAPVLRARWVTLGWGRDLWERENATSVTSALAWSELSDEQRDAATCLGYSAASW